ncbi:dynamin-1-like protein [Citrus sinensis]|nr:dynamin-1-like protein [Citrus sinensis]
MGEEASFSNKNVAASTTIGSSVIPIINRLQDIFSPVDGELSKISLPQVAVVGSQSSGKSSVLEALVGRDFLPRGCDICTRRPLALMLVNRPRNPGDDGREWAEFRHLPGKRFFDFTKVRQEIMAETNKEAGSNRGVSEKQIGLKISSPNVLNMTLVDLPGITKVPVGDQPTDIEARIRKMIMAYIRQENCIILAVSPANSDLATSDALQMAREADPTGSRTIGVITKLDIMDRGTNACNFLLGKVVPLRLGYVGVVNRSQEVYNGLSDRCGIPQLAKKLNQILEQHIRMVLPGLKSELHSRLNAVAKELQKYGDVMESKAEKETMLLNILTKYCEAFSAMVDGRSREISTKELSGGARIRYIFQSIFVKTLEEVDPCQDLTDEDIRTAIQNATGPRNALFVPEVPFEVLVRRQIARLLDPCLQCLRFVYDELIKMSHACAVTELQRFPVLRRHLDDVMGKFIRDSVRPAERMIDSLIEIEDGTDGEKGTLSEIGQRFGLTSQLGNCNVGGNSSSRTWGFPIIFGGKVQAGESPASRSPHETLHNVEQLPSTIQLTEPPSILGPLEMTEQEAVEILVTKLLLQSYYDVVRKNVQDLVPKSIMHFLVNHAKRNLHNTFIQKLYRYVHELSFDCWVEVVELVRENHVEELLQEHDEVAANRRQVKEVSLVLQLAVQTLDEVESEYLPET